jgi:hypothetical protein
MHIYGLLEEIIYFYVKYFILLVPMIENTYMSKTSEVNVISPTVPDIIDNRLIMLT